MTSRWLTTLKRAQSRPRLRLIALPHAGGWPTAFRGWRDAVPPDVELLAAQLPGRGSLLGEPSLRTVDEIVAGLARAIDERPPLPQAIVGHSFGSVLAYELAKELERRHRPPTLLVVSARQPPCFPSQTPFAHLRSDAELLAGLVELGGMGSWLLDRSDLQAPILRAIRADLEALETYARPATRTRVPILALGAADDPAVTAERLPLWSLETLGAFEHVMFDRGGHFYLYDAAVASAIVRRIVASSSAGDALENAA